MSLMHRLLRIAIPSWKIATILPQELGTWGVMTGKRYVATTRPSAVLARQMADAVVIKNKLRLFFLIFP